MMVSGLGGWVDGCIAGMVGVVDCITSLRSCTYFLSSAVNTTRELSTDSFKHHRLAHLIHPTPTLPPPHTNQTEQATSV